MINTQAEYSIIISRYRWSSRRRLIFPRRYFKKGRKKGGNNMERSNIMKTLLMSD